MNAQNYKITIQKIEIDGELYFEATVKEFPDVAVFEDDASTAYALALETIEGLIEMAEDMGHQIPQPSARDEDNYSGKMTFRPGKKLHREIAAWAATDGLSQNQWLCNAVQRAVSTADALSELRYVAANAFASVQSTFVSGWSTHPTSRNVVSAADIGESRIHFGSAGNAYISIGGITVPDLDDDGDSNPAIGADVSISNLIHHSKRQGVIR